MSDIHCLRCQEPWDTYGIQNALDMTRAEAQLFLAGKGCPSCTFGQVQEEEKSITPLADTLKAEHIETFLYELEEGLDGDEALEAALTLLTRPMTIQEKGED